MALYGTGSAPKTEILVNGTWTDYSSRVRADGKISISRGRANEQAITSAQTAIFQLNNRDGLFSNRNPNSALFGLLPRNTQVRIAAGTGDNYGRLNYQSSTGSINSFYSADKAAFDITGNTDVRVELAAHTWRPGLFMVLASKYKVASNQRSWVFYISPDGKLQFRFYVDGTLATAVGFGCDTAVAFNAGRIALRAAVQPNNGASGATVTFYTASSINGSYTQLGSAVTKAGATAIFSSSADVVVGSGTDDVNIFSNGMAFGGRAYAFQLFNGIAGTKVADADFTAQTLGTFTWADSLSNTWNATGTARITSDRMRFWGELSSLPQVWDLTAKDVYVPVTASGMIRRLTQGATPLRSAMYRNFNQYSPAGYWALEDSAGTTSASSSIPGGQSANIINTNFGGSNLGIAGTSSVATFQDATSKIYGNCAASVSTGTVSFVFYMKTSSLPSLSQPFVTLYTANGTIPRITVGLTSTTWDTKFYDSTNTLITTSSISLAGNSPNGQWVGYNLVLQQSGGIVNYSVRWDPVGGASGSGVGPTSLGTQTAGIPNGFGLTAAFDAAFQTASFAQMFMSNTNFDLTSDAFRKASSAWANESAGARLQRLGAEEGVTIEVTGLNSDTELMGAQTANTFMNLVYDCWTTDGGSGGELRDALSLRYRTRVDLENRADATLSLTSSHLAAVPLPVEDDQNFTNDVTVSRPSGGNARFTITDGPTQIAAPPTGVGRYDTELTRNVATDSRLADVAGFEAIKGSWDESRYPQITIGMHRSQIVSNTALFTTITQLELGDTAALTGLPSFLPPDTVYELVQGYTETLGKFLWEIVFNCTPAGPYRSIAVLSSDGNIGRLDGTGHTLTGSYNTVATALQFTTPVGSAVWVDSTNYPNEFPFNTKVAGEVMTVTAISGTTSPQNATVTRSVNGIVKIHNAGELVRIERPFYIGR